MKAILCFLSLVLLGTVSFAQGIFHVQADQGWQSTGIQITAGQNLVIFAIGNVSIDIQDELTYYGPCGITNTAPGSNLPLNTTHLSTLIGKIGSNGQPFGIGEFTVFAPGGQGTPSQSGELYLRVNDSDGNLGDNAGSFSVFICKDVSITLATIQASQGWQNSGASITSGQPYIVYAKGVWTMDLQDNLTWHGAGGVTNAAPGSNLPLNTTHVGTLIGKIGTGGQPFGIGEYTVFAPGGQGNPTSSGDLYLRINDPDGNLGDNDGFMKVFIFQDFASVSISENLVNDFFDLKQNYPNPFNNETIIEYHVANGGQYTLSLYTIEGKFVKNLINQYHEIGNYKHQVNVTEMGRNGFNTGTYYYQLESKGEIVTKKMVVIR